MVLIKQFFNYNIILFMILSILSCGENKDMQFVITDDLKDDLQTLSEYKIYFGHQSVGRDIMNGVQDLKKESGTQTLKLIEYQDSLKLEDTYFAHSRIGQNTDPGSKCDVFSDILVNKLGNKLDVALLKFCYVDIDEKSNVNAIFDYYKTTINKIRETYPDLAVMHVTVPLKSNSGGWKIKIKRMMGKEDYTDPANIKRNEFNEMLKSAFKDDPIFDLAEAESTYPDGSRESFNKNGKTYYSLIHYYTYDGGHLNEVGSKVVASKLIHKLAEVTKRMSR